MIVIKSIDGNFVNFPISFINMFVFLFLTTLVLNKIYNIYILHCILPNLAKSSLNSILIFYILQFLQS